MSKYNKDYFLTLGTIIILYAAHTSPLYFATFAMPTILRAEQAPLRMIGFLGCLMLPYSIKFLWSPYLDRFYSTRLGRRKSWIVPTQIGIVLLLASLLCVTPAQNTLLLFCLLFLLALLSATQDSASGAFIIEQLPANRRAMGNFAQVIGTTLGSACGGALILYCYGHLGWRWSVLGIFGLGLVFLIAILFMREKPHVLTLARQLPALRHFWQQANTRNLLYVCLLYRCCEGLIMGMQQAFLVDFHIPVQTIGIIMGLGNLTIGLTVAAIAGYLFKPLGGVKMLLGLGLIRSFAYFALFSIAYFQIASSTLLLGVIILNMATRLMEMVTLYTIFMNECSTDQAATDFSILMCGELIIYMAGMSISGMLAEHITYTGLFLVGASLSLPSVIISTGILKHIMQTRAVKPMLKAA